MACKYRDMISFGKMQEALYHVFMTYLILKALIYLIQCLIVLLYCKLFIVVQCGSCHW